MLLLLLLLVLLALLFLHFAHTVFYLRSGFSDRDDQLENEFIEYVKKKSVEDEFH